MVRFSRRIQRLVLTSVLCFVPIAQSVAQEKVKSANEPTVESASTAPVLSSISPAAVAVGSGSFTLSLSGSNFLSTSKVLWNSSQRPTTFISSSQLQAAISAQDVLLLGNNRVTVSGSTSPATLSVYLPLVTNDLIYDRTRGVLWASVPSSVGPDIGNSIISVDPYTGVLGPALWVGSEPNKLSISSDGSTLWVTLAGSPSVRKVDLSTMALTGLRMYFPGGWGGNIYASDVAASPGSSSTVAIAAGFVTIYDDATPRPNSGTTGSSYLAYSTAPATLYGYSGNTLSTYTVGSTGITSTQTHNSGNYSNDLRYDNGRLYLTSGEVLDGTTGNLVGTFAASGPVAPDSTLGRAFILNPSNAYGIPDQVTAFDVNTFLPIASFGVGGVDTSSYSPASLVRWGKDGLAFRTDNGVYVVRSSVINDLSATPADMSVSSSAPASSTTGANTSVNFTVKNAGPNAVSDASLVSTFSGSTIVLSASPSQGTCAVGQVVRCDLGQMNVLGSATVSVTVIPVSAGNMTSTGLVSSSLPDSKPSNNHSSSVTSVTGIAYNLVPVLASISPQSAQVGSGALTVTITGSNFGPGSVVNWNTTALPTTFTSSTQLSASVASTLVKFGSAQITVTNAAPGGGSSAALPFSVFRSVTLDTNDVVFDPFTRKLYASIPSTSTRVSGNSIVSIDPLTGKVGTPVFIGSEPTRLGISDDGQYLYVVLSGANAVRRLNLTNLTPGTQFTTVSPLFGAFTASDVSVMPGNPNTVATCGYSDGIQVWDINNSGASARPLTHALANDVYEGSVLAWGSATNLYSNDEGLSPSSLHRFAVGSTSFAETDSTYLDDVDGKITYSGGLLFSDGGGVVDPSPAPPNTPQLVAKLLTYGGGSNSFDLTINAGFFLDPNFGSPTSHVITAIDPIHFISVGSLQFDTLNGFALDLVLWGGNGLAFRTVKDYWGNGIGRVILVRGSFVLPPSAIPNPVPKISALSPNSAVAPGNNTWVTVTGSNFVPGAVASWNGSQRTTIFVDSAHVRVAIAAADLATPGTNKVNITNPSPKGGKSAALTFTVN